MSGADLLRTEVDAVVAEWVERFDRSPIRLHRRTSASALAAVVVQLVEGLASGVDVGPDALAAGRAEVRELERACAFLGGHMAAIGAGGFDVAAALVAFRDAVAPRCGPAFAPALASISEWLMIVAMDSFASAALQAVREQMRDQLEHGTPVVQLLRDVPALFLVGEPDATVLEGVLARSLLTVVAGGARCLIVDASGATDPGGKAMLFAIGQFFAQKRVHQVEVLVVGIAGAVREQWTALATRHEVPLRAFEALEDAVIHAVEAAGRKLLVRRG
jgi:hypothetical protein